MEALYNSSLISRTKNILPFIRWRYLEKVNPLKDKKILVVGLSKTGTTSLHDAFEILGIKSIHYPQPYYLLGQTLEFKWHWKFERVQAYSDIPVVAFLDELIKQYPSSYIIHTTREKASWLRSCEKHFSMPAINPVGEALRVKVYGSPIFDEELFSEKYDRHELLIAEKFKNHPDFIEIKLAQEDKWKGLCELLNVPIPDISYPHSNKYSDKSL